MFLVVNLHMTTPQSATLVTWPCGLDAAGRLRGAAPPRLAYAVCPDIGVHFRTHCTVAAFHQSLDGTNLIIGLTMTLNYAWKVL